MNGNGPGRRPKINEDELLEFLKAESAPVPNKAIGETFNATTETARSAVNRARENGAPIIPTRFGQWYLIKVKTLEELKILLEAITWNEEIRHSALRLSGELKGALGSTPHNLIERAEREDDE